MPGDNVWVNTLLELEHGLLYQMFNFIFDFVMKYLSLTRANVKRKWSTGASLNKQTPVPFISLLHFITLVVTCDLSY